MELHYFLHLCVLVLSICLLSEIDASDHREGRSRKSHSSLRGSRNERSKHKSGSKQCVEIQTDFCNDVISYNATRLPNMFGHRKLRHAERALDEMRMVVETGCSPYLRALLCSLYLPECPHRKKNEPLPPCKPLCEMAKADCQRVYNSFGKEWPLETCDSLPEPRRGSSSKRDRCTNYEPPKPEFCMFHKDVGPCKTYYPFWYYDDIAKGCIPFTYGGCLGNKNRFPTKEACVRTCGNGKTKDVSTTTPVEIDTTTRQPTASRRAPTSNEVLPPELVEPPRDVTIEAGGSVTLMCSASGALEYSWTRVDGSMPESKGRTINDVLPPNKIVEERTMSGRAKLVLQDLDPEDSGRYMCTAENDGGLVEGTAEIIVRASPPVITQFPIAISVMEGGTFIMICAAEGAPPPEVEWTRLDGVVVEQTVNGSISVAEIRSANIVDDRRYQCSATNKYGDIITRDITIQVLVPVFLSEKPQSALVTEGSNAVNLTCTAMGDPLPTITWKKLDGSRDIDEDRYEFDVMEEIGQIGRVTSTLRIYAVQASDAGTYECIASSTLGNQTASATVTVQVPPSFSKQPIDMYASIGEDVTLECYAIGTPPLHIFWWKEGAGNLSLPDSTLPRYSLHNEGMDLNIISVLPEDEGRYHCGVINAADTIVGSMELTVSSTDDLPEIVKGPENVTTAEGETAVFTCNVTGRPLPDVRWMLDEIDIELFGDPRFVRDGTSLVINDVNVRDSGKYRCVAASILGLEFSPSAELIVMGELGGKLNKNFSRTASPTLPPFPGSTLPPLHTKDITTEMKDENVEIVDLPILIVGPTKEVNVGSTEAEVPATSSTLSPMLPGGTLPPLHTIDTTTEMKDENINIHSLLPGPTEEVNVWSTVAKVQTTSGPVTMSSERQRLIYGLFEEGVVCPCEDSTGCSEAGSAILPRRYDITDIGKDGYFRGWVDVKGQGAANDFCRVIEPEEGRMQLVCALAGTQGESEYNYESMLGFDQGMPNTWYMKDEDGDGRDDYCRCAEVEENKYVYCMKAGDTGFDGHVEGGYMDQFTFRAPGDRKELRKCRKRRVDPFFGLPIDPPS